MESQLVGQFRFAVMSCRRLPGCVLLDLSGTVHIGNVLVPGADKAIARSTFYTCSKTHLYLPAP